MDNERIMEKAINHIDMDKIYRNSALENIPWNGEPLPGTLG